MGDSEAGLRERLVDVGAELVAAEGLQALTLREIARRAGVSHGAPRRYFPTHRELLSAIARRGFTELAERVGRAEEESGPDPRARLAALARAYLRFAVEQHGMHELMFRHDLLESGHLGLREHSLPLFGRLVELVARVRPGADARLVGGALWANLHGVGRLWGWGGLQLAVGTDDFERMVDTVLAVYAGSDGE
ncbi:TetR/AcrR family transcriptional regulator [Streptomyces sp. GXMU-J15]|uniref:TetR/AcrR family transcriptional regulator n=1 Tax=Streptomyces fuscus TaxID=3048495 RepID=A0ABT7J7U1_9ACTN|nr:MULTISPECIES: TetR/AcrR family transcriptional regulator [Streptomyces]MDL2080933.1 TetR/AcrR family transcriptional regulator [Streptomyces fuscus]SBT88275.1 transcriptional regulator, TetR family [Streptomyces sp. DI166]